MTLDDRYKTSSPPGNSLVLLSGTVGALSKLDGDDDDSRSSIVREHDCNTNGSLDPSLELDQSVPSEYANETGCIRSPLPIHYETETIEREAAPVDTQTSQHKCENDDGNTKDRACVENGLPLDQSPSESDDDYGPCYRCLDAVCCGCLTKCARGYPRTFAFMFGAVVPIWLLILISYVFGWALAHLESPSELDVNDAIVQSRALWYMELSVYTNITKSLPRICLQLYTHNQTVDWFLNGIMDLLMENGTSSGSRFDAVLEVHEKFVHPENSSLPVSNSSSSTTLVNVDDLYAFMEQCGDQLTPLLNFMFSQISAGAGSTDSVDALSFAWSRCPLAQNATEGGKPLFPLPPFLQESYVNSLMPSSQTEQYVRQWGVQVNILYQQYLVEYEARIDHLLHPIRNSSTWGDSNSTALGERLAQLSALGRAMSEATGREGCTLNLHASVWFWFTVMTTVGYGSQVPITYGGRVMVFSLGFLSILVFGAILANAGSVMTLIVDDFLARQGLHWARKATVSAFLWGLMAYLWMLVIAAEYMEWRSARLDDDLSLGDAYWFAYISTTTVGLGDYYLNPEVMTSSDLVTFPLSFLIGFTFFSGFIGFFSQIVRSPFRGSKLLADNLNTPKLTE